MWDAPELGVVELSRMLSSLSHRGPDERGMVVLGDGRALGHQRLSIVDIEGGHQPFVREPGPAATGPTRCLVANGEIYNAGPLRTDLADAPFTTDSDNEVILHLLDASAGEVGRLRGMYAFALADGDDLVLGRDPLGIKPLYVGSFGSGMVFASELKGLPAGTDRVRAVSPGTTLSTAQGEHRYWTVPEPALPAGTAGTGVEPGGDELRRAARRVRQVLEQAVVARLMADVPVGAFLSGGLDSSAICALLRRHVSELHTFTVGLAGSPDLAAARLVADHLGTIHHEHVLTPDEVVAALPEIVVGLESYDADLVRSAVPTWFVARLAAEHVKVVLTGEGADELFAGYAYHKQIADPVALQAESRRSVGELHHVNLQRVDRMTMAHSLEARVPFLDVHVVDAVLGLAPALRLPTVGGIEKTVLRAAVDDLLPAEIVWRGKAQFDEGSGTADLLPALDALSAGFDVAGYQAINSGTVLRSAEECRYHQLLSAGVERPDVVLPMVARWASRPAAA